MKFKQKKTTQNYLDKLMRFHPDIKFGRKKYKEQYIRIQKNILLSKAYKYLSKRKKKNELFFYEFNFLNKKDSVELVIKRQKGL